MPFQSCCNLGSCRGPLRGKCQSRTMIPVTLNISLLNCWRTTASDSKIFCQIFINRTLFKCCCNPRLRIEKKFSGLDPWNPKCLICVCRRPSNSFHLASLLPFSTLKMWVGSGAGILFSTQSPFSSQDSLAISKTRLRSLLSTEVSRNDDGFAHRIWSKRGQDMQNLMLRRQVKI